MKWQNFIIVTKVSPLSLISLLNKSLYKDQLSLQQARFKKAVNNIDGGEE